MLQLRKINLNREIELTEKIMIKIINLLIQILKIFNCPLDWLIESKKCKKKKVDIVIKWKIYTIMSKKTLIVIKLLNNFLIFDTDLCKIS